MARAGKRVSPVLRGIGIVLRPAPLLTALAIGALLAMAFSVPLFGVPLAVLLLSWTAKHSIATLHAVAGGEREVPVLSMEMIFGSLGGWQSFLAMLALVGLLFATGAASFWLGPLPAAVAGAVATIVLPPVLLTLGWTNNVSEAFNPRATRRIAQALGADFWILAAACAIVAAATILLLYSASTILMIRIAATLVGWLLLIGICGATIHANRDTLQSITRFYRGRELTRSAEEIARERQRQIDDVYATWRSGDRARVWQRIESLAESAPEREDLLRELYLRAQGWDAPLLLDRLAKTLISLDLRAGRTGSALRLARERLAANRAFRLEEAALAQELADAAIQCGDRPTAEALCNTLK